MLRGGRSVRLKVFHFTLERWNKNPLSAEGGRLVVFHICLEWRMSDGVVQIHGLGDVLWFEEAREDFELVDVIEIIYECTHQKRQVCR